MSRPWPALWWAALRAGMANLRPLDPLRSIKVKIGVLVVASIAAASVVFWLGLGFIPQRTLLTAFVAALVVTQVLAHGMTSPLRQMTAAARAMARGDYSRRVQATSRDEVGELARAFNQMAADLAAADQQRRELIANVSHELRTPISALRAVLENLVDGVAEPDQRTLRAALGQSERLGALVTELLDLSRLDAGAASLEVAELAARPFLEEVVRDSAVAGCPVTVQVEVQPPDLVVRADRNRLHQVVANLLGNAYRHSPPGGVVVVTARSATGGGLVLEVTDEGPGIPAEQRERMFARFTRGDGAARADGGTGLGLAIARWAVELHGGSIAVVGATGPPRRPGCRIQVRLPDRPGAPGGPLTASPVQVDSPAA